VEQSSAQRLGSCVLPRTAETEQSEPTNQVARQADHEQPCWIGSEVGERHRGETGVPQSLDVVLDVRIGGGLQLTKARE
jgi:hypothetical protein